MPSVGQRFVCVPDRPPLGPGHQLRDHDHHRGGTPQRGLPIDHHGPPPRNPAIEIIRLYRERWEIETSFLELKSTILDGRVLRAKTPAGVDQEIYALLVT